MKHKAQSLLIVLSLIASTSAHASSFNEVSQRVHESPIDRASESLPHYGGLSLGGLTRALLGWGGELVGRIKGTLWTSNDFKKTEPKLLHPMGVCADVDWVIRERSGATGLLAAGTHVKGIVRFSAAAAQTEYVPGESRALGLAFKLFPTQDLNEDVTTANMFLFDNFGLDGSDRPEFLKSDRDIFFQNKAKGGGVAGDLLIKLFKRFDSHPEIRPLYPLTEITSDNQEVTAPVTPQLIRLVPNLSPGARGHAAKDFRDEILSYGAGEIRFDIYVSPGKPIGQITVGKPVVTITCDQELHFAHPRVKR